MPLIYNGQEAGNDRRLEFFEKDPIEWQDHPIGDLYKKLFVLMKENSALWHSEWGATMIRVPNSSEESVLSFFREDGQGKVFAVFNFSDEWKSVEFTESLQYGEYINFFSDEAVEFDESSTLEIEPWDYRVFVK